MAESLLIIVALECIDSYKIDHSGFMVFGVHTNIQVVFPNGLMQGVRSGQTRNR
jgi:hypothetical protein